jgi:hypothetical protein
MEVDHQLLDRVTTIQQFAEAIRPHATNPADAPYLVRLSREVIEHATMITMSATQEAFLAEPKPTGSRHWDAYLAALAAYVAHLTFHAAAPTWTRRPSWQLKPRWRAVGPADYSKTMWDWINTPVEFHAKGIVVNRNDLAWI